jgi:glycerol uptake facilitator-like aquaporin
MYRSWANLLIRIFCLVSIVLGLLALSKNTSGTNLLMQIFTIGLNIWIIWYLMRPQTKALFSRGKK